ncbi:MAG: hypothetical protein HYS32_04545 [Candidatus Woesearchaeota archaeon]|nr:MAG: hypothetical protein HYS32_04545 [Candidatus Woesearchaeota archaeon]
MGLTATGRFRIVDKNGLDRQLASDPNQTRQARILLNEVTEVSANKSVDLGQQVKEEDEQRENKEGEKSPRTLYQLGDAEEEGTLYRLGRGNEEGDEDGLYQLGSPVGSAYSRGFSGEEEAEGDSGSTSYRRAA